MIETVFERLLYASRWLLAPLYLGLSFALLAVGIKFFQEVIHLLPHIFTITEANLVLTILTLIDLSLVGGLIVMVMLSGYENFVSAIELAEEDEKLAWLGKLDTSSLKQKVAASIIAISSIHLLQVFMNAGKIDNGKIMWYVIMHLTFVVSAMGVAFVDKLSAYKQH
jgi:uncharacterized protein (TIGR00645 family)